METLKAVELFTNQLLFTCFVIIVAVYVIGSASIYTYKRLKTMWEDAKGVRKR